MIKTPILRDGIPLLSCPSKEGRGALIFSQSWLTSRTPLSLPVISGCKFQVSPCRNDRHPEIRNLKLPCFVGICLQVGMSEPTFYVWKRKCAGLGLSELGQAGSLREEHVKLIGTCCRRLSEKRSNRLRKNSLGTPAFHRSARPSSSVVREASFRIRHSYLVSHRSRDTLH